MRRRRKIPIATLGLVAVGGVVGAVARYGVARGVPTPTDAFPWATFTVNVSGSLALGVLLTLVVERVPRGRMLRPLVGTGVIGAYTTFATLAVETVLLVRDGRAGTAALYLAASLAAGLAAATAGIALTRGAVRSGRVGRQTS